MARSNPNLSLRTAPAEPQVPTTRETAAIVGSIPPRKRQIGQSDLIVFPLALSGNVFGWKTDDAAANEILDTYAAQGGDFLDTADSYAGGRSEIMIGNWMRARRNRSDIVVATKVGKSSENPGLRARVLTRAVHASLQRLGTDYIDLLYLHIDDESVDFDETLLAVDELIRAGTVRYFGASDHSGNRLIEARIASAQLGVAPMVALQQRYNLLDRNGYEGDLARVAQHQGLGVMPRFALASGFLSGKYRSKSDIPATERGVDAGRYLNKRGLRVLASLDSIAALHDTSVASVAIAWLLTQPRIVAPVVSASRPDQVLDLTAGPSLQLSRHQVAELDRVSS